MSDFNRGYARTVPADRADMSVDVGLRSFMLGVYNKVALGLVLSAAMAYLTGQYAPVRDLMFKTIGDRFAGYTPLGMVVVFAPLAILLISSFAMRNQTSRAASAIYWAVVLLMGASLGTVTLVYTGASVASTFLITATAFGALSLFGYSTKRDLTGFGSFLMIGLVGLVISSLVSWFWNPPGFSLIISVIGVFIFAGLTAYDTQRLKMTYYQVGGDEAAMGVATSYGALSLYLDFLNMFLFLLRIFGGRR
jgi:FtsH-binding integral membrane protein